MLEEGVKVGVIMGSDTDLGVMNESVKVLKELEIGYEIDILSAHRIPELVVEYAKGAQDRLKVIIAGAGAAAHLPGVIASNTLVPVIGVPLDATSLKGVDSVYSILQMPGGIPVATMAIGKAGAKNAGLYAAQMISLFDEELRGRLKKYRTAMGKKVIARNEELKRLGVDGYLLKSSNKRIKK